MSSKITRHDEIVQIFCQDENTLDNVIYIEDTDTFCLYDNKEGYWKFLEELETKKMFYEFMKQLKIDKGITDSMIQDIMKLTRLEIMRRRPNALSHYLAMKDKTLNLRTLAYEEHNREHHAFQFVNVYAEEVEKMRGNTPLFSDYIATSLVYEDTRETDPSLVALVQEMFGFLILDEIEKHAAFNLVGEGANGKSVMVDIVRELVGGDRFCVAFSLEQLSDKYNKSEIIGKRVNLCSEDESEYIRADTFKAIVAGDVITAQRKYMGTVTFRSTMKILVSSNHYLRFNRVDGALMRRIYPIPFFRIFKEEEQKTKLAKKIIEHELPGVVAWAIDGAKRLQANKMLFTKSAQVEQQKDRLAEEISSSIQFIREKYVVDEHSFTTSDDLYLMYSTWCSNNGRSRQHKNNFGKDIARIVGKSFTKSVAGLTIRGYAVREKTG